MNFDQLHLIKKLAAYVKQNLNDPALVQSLENCLGLCYGFSITHAVMALIDKQNWWQQALLAVANWDEQQESLQQECSLMDGTLGSLDNIFHLVKDWVIAQQQNVGRQANDLTPFQLASQPITFPTKTTVAGHFSSEQLEELLNEEEIQNSLCLIRTQQHITCVSYRHGHWYCYDPNYDHHLETVETKFKNKADLVAEINRIHGKTVAITIAYTQDNRQAAHLQDTYKKLIPLSAGMLIGCMPGDHAIGIQLIARSCPEYLLEILSLVAKKPNGKEFLAILFKTPEPSENHTGMHMVSAYASGTLAPLLDYVHQANGGDQAIADAAMIRDVRSVSALDLTIEKCPNDFDRVLECIRATENGNELIAHALISPNARGATILHLCAALAPEKLDALLDLPHTRYGDKVVQALLMQQDDSALRCNTLHLFALKMPQKKLEEVLDFVANQPNGIEAMAIAAIAENVNGETALDYVAHGNPGVLAKLFYYAVQSSRRDLFLAACEKLVREKKVSESAIDIVKGLLTNLNLKESYVAQTMWAEAYTPSLVRNSDTNLSPRRP